MTMVAALAEQILTKTVATRRLQERVKAIPDLIPWAEAHYYLPETTAPIQFAPHQKAVLYKALERRDDGSFRWRTVVWSQIKKSGKALALDTPLPTPTGWTTMGDVQEGDVLFDEHGQPCTVTFATPIQEGHPCYRIIFSDGSTIVADADHQWAVEVLQGAKYRAYIMTTEALSWGLTRAGDGARLYRIPLAKPLQLPDVDLPVNPYVLGSWLGDGDSASSRFTGVDQEILDRIAQFEPVRSLKVTAGKTPQYRIGGGQRGAATGIRSKSETLTGRLRSLGLLHNKHIPPAYLRASYVQRLALLQGLMDTDGTIGANGNCEFSVTAEGLAYSCRELLTTLGIKSVLRTARAMLYGKDCGARYRIGFHAPEDVPVFYLARKRERQMPRVARVARSLNRHIIRIEPVDSVPVRCIQVDAPSHLYLAGEEMIPTHNTAVSGAVGRWAAETWGPYQEIVFVGNDADQAKERAFAAAVQSIELTPGYNYGRRLLPGRWSVLDASAAYANGSALKAVAVDYKGEAGANPSMTIWTELWGYIDKAALRFWAELAPSPTRTNSLRWVETYAGYEGESELLWGLYDATVLHGRQLTTREIQYDPDIIPFAESPNPDDLVPIWVNEPAGVFAYWDSGDVARRMPWQQGEHGAAYYATEQATQTPGQYTRLHRNEWVSAESAFVDILWWDACTNPLPLLPGERTPLVIALDAAVTGDNFALVVISRDPNNPKEAVAVRASYKWEPPPGGRIDFAGPEKVIRDLCAAFNVKEVAYDPYQLEDMASRLYKDRVAWFRPFPQGQDRLKADKLLYDLIVQKRIRHDGNLELREHVANANAKLQKDADSTLRIVKKAESRKIDLCVAMSMGASECLRLALI